MQIISLILVALVGMVLLLLARALVQMTGSAAAAPPASFSPPAMSGYLALRDKVLRGSRMEFGLPARATISEPWGVVVDMIVDGGFVTVASLADGSAGIYLSAGASVERGRSTDSVRTAARLTVEMAQPCQPMMRATNAFPLPDPGEMAFYALTDLGVFAALVSAQELAKPLHPMANLAQAAQNVITQYRLSQQPK